MKKMFIIALLLAPVFCFAQKDFDYTLSFSKCFVYQKQLTKAKTDTLVLDSTETRSYTVIKKENRLTVYSGGGAVASYSIICRGVQGEALGYISGWRDIVIMPERPFLRVVDNEKVTIYQ